MLSSCINSLDRESALDNGYVVPDAVTGQFHPAQGFPG